MKNEHSSSRREFVKKAAYVAPVILTLQAAPSYAKAGSENGKPSKPEPRLPQPRRPIIGIIGKILGL
ncbi:MAG: hypothetical protein U1E63_10725 [Burkholderiales bacterium]